MTPSEPEISTVLSSSWTSNVVVPVILVPSSTGVIKVVGWICNSAPSFILNLIFEDVKVGYGGVIVIPSIIIPSNITP